MKSRKRCYRLLSGPRTRSDNTTSIVSPRVIDPQDLIDKLKKKALLLAPYLSRIIEVCSQESSHVQSEQCGRSIDTSVAWC